MTAYLLIREGVAFGHALLAAIARKDMPELTEWVTGSAEMEYRMLSDEEFERMNAEAGAIVLFSELEQREVAIAFGPREEWPADFDRFLDFFDEVHRRMSEEENVTEEAWLGWDDRPAVLANFALPHVSDRKLRLFMIGCCGLVADAMVDDRSKRAVEMAVRYVDGEAGESELRAAHDAAVAARMLTPYHRDPGYRAMNPQYAAAGLASGATGSIDRKPTEDMPDGWMSICAAATTSDSVILQTCVAAAGDPLIGPKISTILRDICGNPFDRVRWDDKWSLPRVIALANTIYDRNEYGRLAELADAMEEEGCREQSVLDHCRSSGPHVKGCWVLDLVLGLDETRV
jgi:hypothetical protein